MITPPDVVPMNNARHFVEGAKWKAAAASKPEVDEFISEPKNGNCSPPKEDVQMAEKGDEVLKENANENNNNGNAVEEEMMDDENGVAEDEDEEEEEEEDEDGEEDDGESDDVNSKTEAVDEKNETSSSSSSTQQQQLSFPPSFLYSAAAAAAAASPILSHMYSMQQHYMRNPLLPQEQQQAGASACNDPLVAPFLASEGSDKRKRNRTFIDPVSEVPRLEEWFLHNTHPSQTLIARYTDELNLLPYRQKFPKLEQKNIQFWFKNRRAKCKRMNASSSSSSSCI